MTVDSRGSSVSMEEGARHTPARRRAARAPAATIYDIAKLAGVNPSTVSRALNQPGRINIKTEQRIREAAEELNYRVNPFARALPTGRTMTLGFIVADITNPVLFGIIRGAERAAAQLGYTLIIAESQESGEREAVAAERVLPSVDGLVLATTRLGDAQIQNLASQKPLVLINRDVEGVDCIVPEISIGIDQAVEHLAQAGHRRIAYLSGPETSWISRRRAEAISSAADRAGIQVIQLGPASPTLAGGPASLPEVLASGATAVIAYNDLMAIGLLREAQKRGMSIPRDLSLIGFDDIFGSDFTTPPLTTIRMPLAEAGHRAVHAVLTVLGEDVADLDETPLTTELVVRDSVATLTS
jgi:LacI family transcriptional regulator